MKNLGITNYASLVSMQLNNEMEIFINPVEETKNVHYILQLYNSIYKRPLDLQLIYNHQNLSIDLGLGKGIRTNYHVSLSCNDEEACLTLADGSILIYPLLEIRNYGKIRIYENKENNTKISVDSSMGTQFFWYLKDGTIVEFIPAGNKLMQKSIKCKNGEEYYFKYDSLGRMIEIKNNANKVEKVTLDYTTNDFVLIQVWKTNRNNEFSEIRMIKLYKHTAANYLDFLWNVYIYDNSSSTLLLKNYYFGYSIPGSALNTSISESVSKRTCSYRISIDGFPMIMKDQLGKETTFSSVNKYCSKVTDYKNRISELLVDKKGKLICVKDNFRNRVISTMFDENNKLISSSKVIHYNPSINGKLQISSNSVTNGRMETTLIDTPSFLSSFYQTSKCYRLETTYNSNARFIQVYDVEGNKFDVFSLGVWSKLNSFNSSNGYITVNIFFTNTVGSYRSGKQFCKEIKILLKNLSNHEYEFYMTSAYAKQSYKYVVIELCNNNSQISMDVIFDLYKRGLTSQYEYDKDGNQISCLDGRHIGELVFNGDNTIASTAFINYEYDEKGNIIKSKDAFGKEEKMEYDESNNLLTQSIINGNTELYSKNEYLDEENISLTKDNNDVEISCEQFDDYMKSKDIQKYDENNRLYVNYEHNKNDKTQIISKTYKDNDVVELGKINYSYNSCGNILSISNNDVNSNIEYSYDEFGQHCGYKINGKTFTYNTYSLFNDIPELINSSGIGTKDTYYYEYDNYDRLIKIKYSANSSILFEYTYDDNDNIKTIKNHENNITYSLEYDEECNLVSYSYDDMFINNVFDENSNICAKKVNVNNEKIITTNYSIYKSLNNDFDTYKLSIRNSTNILLCMFDEYAVTYKDEATDKEYVKHEQKIKLLNTMTKSAISSETNSYENYCGKDGFITLYSLNSTNPISFNVSGKVDVNNSVAFLFSVATNGTLISLNDESTNSLKISLNSASEIVIADNNDTLFISTKSYATNVWHFICVTYDLSNKKLFVKIDGDEFTTTFNNSYSSLHVFTFGASIIGKITNIMIPQGNIISDDDYDSYYKSTKYLIALNESRKNSDGNIVKKSSKEFIKNIPYDFIPLNNGTLGFENEEIISPINDTVLELPCLSSKNSEFIYNDKIEKSAYFAMGQQLVYKFNQSTSGTLSIHANRLFKDEENTLFDLVDENNNHITLSIYENKFKLVFGDVSFNSISTRLLYNTNTWNVITLTWRKNVTTGYDVIVWIGTRKIINTTLYPTQVFKTFNVHIGRNSDTSNKYGKCFNGLLETLIFSTRFLSGNVDEIVTTINQMNKVSHEYDALNLLRKAKVVDKNNEILTNEYEYKALSNSSSNNLTRISTLVNKETINEDVYEYDYDIRGNLTSIKRNESISHTYSYDKLGRLIIADNEIYDYDNNGNILSVTNKSGNILHTYQYDEAYSDLLISFDNQAIVYDYGNTYNPISIGTTQSLTYQCRRLSTFRDISQGFYNMYYYDDLGNRIKKLKYNNSGTLLDTIKFYNDENGKLIHQKSGSAELTFLYDELNQLYGFIYGNNRYYYIKDCLNTILGIISSTGSIVVKYNYDVWGNILNISDTSGISLGTINPFRYKCYYYDEDILMYYCKTRYYVPAWRRWLTPDEPKNNEFIDIDACNLFIYCSNAPSNNYDMCGKFWIKFACVIVSMCVSFISEAIEDYKEDGKLFNGDKSLNEYVGAIASGMISSFGGGLVSSVVLGVVGDTVGALINGDLDDETNITGFLVTSAITNVIGCSVGNFLGKCSRKVASNLKASKIIKSKGKVSNNTINKELRKITNNLNIGANRATKDTIAKEIFATNKWKTGKLIEDVVSSLF